MCQQPKRPGAIDQRDGFGMCAAPSEKDGAEAAWYAWRCENRDATVYEVFVAAYRMGLALSATAAIPTGYRLACKECGSNPGDICLRPSMCPVDRTASKEEQ
jgi:hypothetical protein